ncbi:MAG: hypothetical protein ACOC1K_00925 [Nanoarchaeota archaeon]
MKVKVLPLEVQNDVLINLNKKGVKMETLLEQGYKLIDNQEFDNIRLSISSNPNGFSTLDLGQYAVRYKYVGPRDGKNRNFCAKVLDADLIYRKEDILNGTNNQFGDYNLFIYKGSYNCRHKWERVVFVKTDGVSTQPMDDYRQVPKGYLPSQYSPDDEEATKVNQKVQMKNTDYEKITDELSNIFYSLIIDNIK